MTQPWIPEFEVTPRLATQLIESQFPALKPLKLQHLGSGWDNVVYLANDKWYFRFPQRQIAVEGVQREMDVLPVLAALITGLPRIEFKGSPSADYAWPFFGYHPVSGEEPARMERLDRGRLAVSLARFLHRLHGPEVFAKFASKVPEDPGRLNFQKQVPRTEERLEKLAGLGVQLPQERLREILRAGLDTPTLPCKSLVHGDLHFRHLITTPTGDLKGLIDWGDMHLNDPAVDLQLYWSFFSGADRQTFLQNYGPLSPIQKIQSRSFAVFLSVALLTAALDQGQAFIAREAMDSLTRTLQD